MIQGLVIRQAFFLLNLILVVLLVAAGGIIVFQYVQPVPDVSQQDDIAPSAAVPSITVASVKPLSAYQGILRSGLFGKAGQWDGSDRVEEEEEVVEVVQDEVEETALSLKLIGAQPILGFPKDPTAAAVIINMESRGDVQSYGVGDTVVDNVTLEEVYDREVIILNQRQTPPVRERLSMDEQEEDKSLPVYDHRNARRPGAGNITLSKDEIIRDLSVNYADLVSKVKPRPQYDKQGKMVGMTADNISRVPLARKLGLKDGDVLESINGEKIDSEAKVIQLINKYRNASSFKIGVQRNGRTQTINYSLR